ncbi:MAG: ankyrin repeat domain-containing protein [Planctomycetota bacterium]
MATTEDKIRFYCGACGKRLKADPAKVGRSARCTKCGKAVPVPRKQLSRAQIRLYCPACGARIRAFAERSGKRVKCTRCGENILLAEVKKQNKPEPQIPHPRIQKPDKEIKAEAPPKKESTPIPPVRMKRKAREKIERPSPSVYVIPVPEERERPAAAAEPEKTAVPRRFSFFKIISIGLVLLLAIVVVGFTLLRATSPEWLNVRLMRAARDGDARAVRMLLLCGADVNSKTPIPQTPLHWAAMKGRRDVAEVLIDRGADINATDENGKTPLLQAVSFGHSDIAQLLISRGANASMADSSGFAPLYQAAYVGNKDVVELLVAAGADVNATVEVAVPGTGSKPQPRRLTALDAAEMAGHTDVAVFLRNRGARTSMETK